MIYAFSPLSTMKIMPFTKVTTNVVNATITAEGGAVGGSIVLIAKKMKAKEMEEKEIGKLGNW